MMSCVFSFLSLSAGAHQGFGAKPNILVLLADDFGWANLGSHRSPESSPQALKETYTPHLDGLIKEGVLLERHYAYKICAPSRSSFQR